MDVNGAEKAIVRAICPGPKQEMIVGVVLKRWSEHRQRNSRDGRQPMPLVVVSTVVLSLARPLLLPPPG